MAGSLSVSNWKVLYIGIWVVDCLGSDVFECRHAACTEVLVKFEASKLEMSISYVNS